MSYAPIPPYIVFNDYTGDKRAFFDPADAIQFIVELGDAVDVIDGNGTSMNLNLLEEAMRKCEKQKPSVKKYQVDIHTDGACSGNPGPGGYAGIIVFCGKEKTIRGYDLYTTNNAMELKAVVESIKVLSAPCEVTVHTDSQYLCNCSKHDRAWFSKDNRPNKELWFELITEGLVGKHHIKFVKVEGHSGEVYNERCDRIAKEQAKKASHILAGCLKED